MAYMSVVQDNFPAQPEDVPYTFLKTYRLCWPSITRLCRSLCP